LQSSPTSALPGKQAFAGPTLFLLAQAFFLRECCRKQLDALAGRSAVEAMVPGGEQEVLVGQHECGGKMQ
jgi:hypothetical protein